VRNQKKKENSDSGTQDVIGNDRKRGGESPSEEKSKGKVVPRPTPKEGIKTKEP